MKVREIMSSPVFTVLPEATLKDAAARMIDNGVSGLPVVDDEGRLVGIVTEADFLRREAMRGRRVRLLDVIFGRGDGALADAARVSEAMSGEVVTIDADAPLVQAARLMATEEVKRLPVVDSSGALVGIVSRADVMAAFARDDEEIAADIAELLSRRVLPVDPEVVTVRVSEGVVGLAGTVENRSDATVLEEFISRLPGVVDVDNELAWASDDTAEAEWAGYAQERARGEGLR